MKLDAFHSEFAVTQTHDGTVRSFGVNFQHARQGFAFDYERMVARGCEWFCESAEDCFPVVENFAGFAVENLFRTDYAPAECFAHRLMTQAHAENRNLACESFD